MRTIPNSVTSIGRYAFYGCTGLTSVTIPNSVTSIGEYAFSGCSGLTSVTIGNSVTSIGSYTFGNCSLKSVTIGSGVLTIGSSVFYDNKPAKVIWLTNTPPSGYSYAAGTVNYVANNQYTSLSNKTVYPLLSSLFEVDGVKYVPVSMSDRTCDAIDCLYDERAEHINIGQDVTYKGVKLTVSQVHPYACYSNKNIKDVYLSLTGNIGNFAFYDCDNLATADITNTGDIGDCAFKDCDKMTNVSITNIGTIGQQAFYSCDKLTTATIANTSTVGNYAFYDCKVLETATLGEQVSGLGQYCFSGCSALKGIVVPNSVKTIGQYAFQNCSSMTSVKMGTGVSTIETYTFSGCSSLTDMQIGSRVGTIGTYAFNNCSSLPLIEIPQAVTKVNNYAFSGCTGLKNVYMADRNTVLTLGSNGSNPLFSSCPLDSVYIGGNISYSTSSSYGYSPFYRNTSLRAVTITDLETEISDNEFYGCTNLKRVSIGESVTTIGKWAFSGCANLDYFAFGSSVTTIGQEAFSDCVQVTKIISRAAAPPTCGSQALDDISKWTCTLEVPAGCVSAYQAATQWKEFVFTEEEDVSAILYTLTYMVDDETYKTYDLHYGDEIPAEAQPTKYGYVFSGWGEVPATMPARDVTIRGTFTEIPVEDVSGNSNYLLTVGTVETKSGTEATLPIAMKNELSVSGFQFDLSLPAGFTLATDSKGKVKVTKTDRFEDDDQMLNVTKVGDNTWRFISFSMSNSEIAGTSGVILNAVMAAAETVEQGTYQGVISAAVFTRPDGTQLKLADTKFNIVISNTIDGDANGDGEVNVTDIVEMVNCIMDKPSARFVEAAADLNGDGEVNVTDIVLVVNIIMAADGNGARSSERAQWASTANDRLTLVGNGDGQPFGLWLTNGAAYVASQFDIRLAAGQTLEGVALNDSRAGGHWLTCEEIADGLYRVVVCSPTGTPYRGDSGELLTVSVKGQGEVAVENVLFVTADAAEKRFADLHSGTTAIGTARLLAAPADVYTTDGRMVRRQATSLDGLKKGVYIVNGRKEVVR